MLKNYFLNYQENFCTNISRRMVIRDFPWHININRFHTKQDMKSPELSATEIFTGRRQIVWTFPTLWKNYFVDVWHSWLSRAFDQIIAYRCTLWVKAKRCCTFYLHSVVSGELEFQLLMQIMRRAGRKENYSIIIIFILRSMTCGWPLKENRLENDFGMVSPMF